jgi:HlyD family secretion protein
VARIQREGDRVTGVGGRRRSRAPGTPDPRGAGQAAIRPPVRRGAIALPLAAVVRRPDGAGALVVDGGHVHFKAVRLGVVDPAGWVEVLDGLRAGDEVVVAPGQLADRANEGRRVRVTRAAAGP